MDLLPTLQAVSRVLILIVSLCYCYQVLYLILPFFRKEKPAVIPRAARYAILIAARNEEAVIGHLLDSIHSQDYPADLVTAYVVADNCTDRTAEIAQSHGARVFSRFSKTRVGKGYALNFLLRQIDRSDGLDSYDAFLVFDADNLLLPDYVNQINQLYSRGYEAFCGYRNSKNFGTNWISRGYGIWYLHTSCHLNQSRMMLGTSCAVNGTGFGFTRELLERCGGWNFFTLTEDLEFNAWCATQGVRIGYTRDAVLFDEQPENFRQSWRQRTRWTQGGLQVSLKYAGDFLTGIFKGGRTGYASFETATLSLWGCCLSGLSFCLKLLVTFLKGGWASLAPALLLALISTYAAMFFIGGLTVVTEWKRIRASSAEKILSAFAFPLYIITNIPIALTALFRKFQWQPIAHTVAISANELRN